MFCQFDLPARALAANSERIVTIIRPNAAPCLVWNLRFENFRFRSIVINLASMIAPEASIARCGIERAAGSSLGISNERTRSRNQRVL